MTDPEGASSGPNEPSGAARAVARKRALRRKTLKFVLVFVVSVLVLLSSYQMANGTCANDWYLFQVARTTSWFLRHFGYSCTLGSAGRLSGMEAQVRHTLDAWSRGEKTPKGLPPPDVSRAPLTSWQAWQYKAGTVRQIAADARADLERLEQDTSLPEAERAQKIAQAQRKLQQLRGRNSGPLVSFVLRADTPRRLRDANAQLDKVKRDASLSDDVRAERVAEAEAEVERLKKKQQELKSSSEGAEREPKELTFSFIVIPDCGAIPSMSIFFSAILAFPALWRKKLLGVALGIPILYVVNAFRLAFLAVIGALDNGGNWFRFSHEYIWQGIYIIFVVALWMGWVEFVVRRRD